MDRKITTLIRYSNLGGYATHIKKSEHSFFDFELTDFAIAAWKDQEILVTGG